MCQCKAKAKAKLVFIKTPIPTAVPTRVQQLCHTNSNPCRTYSCSRKLPSLQRPPVLTGFATHTSILTVPTRVQQLCQINTNPFRASSYSTKLQSLQNLIVFNRFATKPPIAVETTRVQKPCHTNSSLTIPSPIQQKVDACVYALKNMFLKGIAVYEHSIY